MVCGYREENLALLSDKICTALQLANFWQDVVEDSDRGRRYIPGEYMQRFNVAEGQLNGRVFTPDFRAMMQALVARTRTMLLEGGAISACVDNELPSPSTSSAKAAKPSSTASPRRTTTSCAAAP